MAPKAAKRKRSAEAGLWLYSTAARAAHERGTAAAEATSAALYLKLSSVCLLWLVRCGRLVGRSVGWVVGWLVGWVGGLVGWWVGGLVGWLVGRSVGRSMGRSVGR